MDAPRTAEHCMVPRVRIRLHASHTRLDAEYLAYEWMSRAETDEQDWPSYPHVNPTGA